ncbi:MAG: hypothetical protein JW870_10420 [Candidatus Delongbacteria bacterium]|nr:hypothetical protein [Candidatus Delongbacteria bacterium]
MFLDDYEEVMRHVLSYQVNNKKSEYLEIKSAYKAIKIIEMIKKSINSEEMKK